MPSTRIPKGFQRGTGEPVVKDQIPIDTILRYSALIDFAAGTKKVQYIRADRPDDVFEGIVRCLVRDEKGGMLFGSVSDHNYVRITSTSGPEFFVRIGLITAMYEVIE